MHYRRCGKSGLLFPELSLGLWHNFGTEDAPGKRRELVLTAFDLGITHFDLANNYGPPPGEAERSFGKIMKEDLHTHRDEVIISTKAGYRMWPGPYGDGGSKKYLTASLDQSLARLGLDYVDIFYHHRPDPETPLRETAEALAQIVQQGKALYIGLSSYSPAQTQAMVKELANYRLRVLIHQPKYSMLERSPEKGLLNVLEDDGIGCIAFSSLAQGLLTNKYLNGIPSDSRAASGRGNGAIESSGISREVILKIKDLNEMAVGRGQTLAQMALAWILKDKRMTSVIIGASKPEQIKDSVQAINSPAFDNSMLSQIDKILQPA